MPFSAIPNSSNDTLSMIASAETSGWLPESVQVSILAVIQGIAEFLPISSSGHLNVFQTLLSAKAPESAELNIVLHFGTLLAILLFYWRRILALLTSDRRVIPMLIIGTVPAAVIGIIVKKKFPHILNDPLLAGCMFPITGLMLIVLHRLNKGKEEYVKMPLWKSFAIGCAQAFALLPGISRSGSTIVAGSMLGLKQDESMTFSFLLAIPAILGASVLELKDIYDADWATSTPPWILLLGTVIAFVVGLGALRWLDGLLKQGKLHWFAWYLIPLGILVVIWRLFLA
jgi:undecaprenyl-diphosphatase